MVLSTVDALVKKDFALEADEFVLRQSGVALTRYLSSAVAMLSAKENFAQSMYA